ncbi:hypothetical protein [Flavobacterium sp.]|jgi:hypothetical protein|uniref:hypothetical protein n=1 Tax=Flavobacterium sp. TaxID=239 RepID=UPI002A7ED484|nr:hypothetical protein [Flavobacterium sp.]
MSSNPQDQEIDLGQVFNKIGNLFQKGIDSIFDLFLFLKRNFLILMILLISGIVLGYFLDKNNKSYTHEIIVTPNFASVDYLYSKVELLKSKKNENDTTFLNSLGIKNVKNLNSIEIDPIVNIYSFIGQNNTNFEFIKLLAEDGDLEKIIKEETTSKNYPYHIIKITTNEQSSEDNTTQPIISFLNQSEYYSNFQKEFVNNIYIKMKANDSAIAQIDKLLDGYSSSIASSQKSENLVYNNENNQVNDILKTKDGLISEQGSLRMSLVNNDKIVKSLSTTINLKNTKGLNGKMKLVFPILFIGLFFIFYLFKLFYIAQLTKRL